MKKQDLESGNRKVCFKYIVSAYRTYALCLSFSAQQAKNFYTENFLKNAQIQKAKSRQCLIKHAPT